MFVNFFFLFFLILIINIGADSPFVSWIESPVTGFFYGIICYFLALTLICIQNRFLNFRKGQLLVLANFELITSIALFQILFEGQRFFPNSQILIILFLLALYFIGLFFFHFAFSRKKDFHERYNQAKQQIQILIPFTIPFLILVLFIDIGKKIPFLAELESHPLFPYISIAIIGILLICGLIFLPKLVKKTWGCVPLEESPLKSKLEEICKKSHFNHAGLMTWPLMEPSLTAAILGINPHYRYIMFTPSLLKQFPDEEIEAILAHEIGHSKHKHLLLYPLILMGMIGCFALFITYLGDAFIETFISMNLYYPSKVWESLVPLAIAIPFGIIGWIYFRYIFGFYSRLFERQADLYIYHIGLPGQWMVNALDHIGKASGNTHHLPSWHHHSLKERIDFLKEVEENRKLITQHDKRVRFFVYFYFFIFTLIIIFNNIYAL